MRDDSHYWKVKNDSTVTIIIAAYLRYKPLNIALRSIYKQSYKDWRVLVIADCCDSSWVIRNSLSKKIGYWNRPDYLLVTPVMDWI